MDNLQWFKFSPSDWMMGRIQRQPPQVQVDFIRVCCKYWQKEGALSIEDAELESGDSYQTLLKFRLIREKDGLICIGFLEEQMVGISAKREQASMAGKRSAEVRKRSAESNDRSTTVGSSFNENQQRRVEKSKSREELEKSREEKGKVGVPPTPATESENIIFLKQEDNANTPRENSSFNPPEIAEVQRMFTATMETMGLPTDAYGGAEKMATSFHNYYSSQGWRKANGLSITSWRPLIPSFIASEKASAAKKTDQGNQKNRASNTLAEWDK